MKQRVQQNSLRKLTKANSVIGKVYACFQKGYRMSYQNVVDLTGLSVNTVVGRINGLRFDYGLIVVDGVDIKGRNIYRMRKDGEPIDVREEKNILITKDIIEILSDLCQKRIVYLSYDKLIIDGKKYEFNADELFKLL